jgi:hypothetical protein
MGLCEENELRRNFLAAIPFPLVWARISQCGIQSGSWERRLSAGTAGRPLFSGAARMAALRGGSRLAKATELLLAAGVLIGALTTVVFADEEELHKIGGRVIDHLKRPVSGANVRLYDEEGDVLKADRSESDGSFDLSHKPSGNKCLLEVIPREDSGLASALIEGVPGDKDRSFVVELHQGFSVSGRIEHAGKGLKGIVVKVSPALSHTEHTDVHGGGFAVTGRDGRFHMTLTPGNKHLEIYNEKYGDLSRRFESSFTVTAALSLPDVMLPASAQ